jgi:4-diphosphocytidyl-2-C-methyl-D-erythritol kinase
VRRYEVEAPAKVNLTLHVLGRRADGFHDIASLFVPIDLADRLEVTVGGETIDVRVPGHPELEGEGNLCAKAARAFAARTGLPAGMRVTLHKHVPVAAGLGGGSSDAAAVLRCLAAAHGLDVDEPRIRAAALDVGSDVPFFLRCEPAVARGRGEILERAPALPPLFLAIVKPPFGVSAAEAYRALAALRSEGRLPGGREVPLPPALHHPDEVLRMLHNDLEPAVATLYPVAEVKERLLAAGARAALMSGSGSCVFLLSGSAAERDLCSKSVRLLPGEGLFAAGTLQRAPALRDA